MKQDSFCVNHPDLKAIGFCNHCRDWVCYQCATEGSRYYYCHKPDCQQAYQDEEALIAKEKSERLSTHIARKWTPTIRSYWRAFAETIGLTALYFCLHYLPLPTVGPLLDQCGQVSGKLLHSANMMSLGLTPVISGFFCTEFFSLIIRPLSRWRLEGTAGREKLNRTAWVLTLLFSFIQALGTSFYIRNIDPNNPPVLVPTPGFLFHLLNITALMGGTFLAIWLARLITRVGVGNGFLILTLPLWLMGIFDSASKQVAAVQGAGLSTNDRYSWFFTLALFLLSSAFIWKFIQRGPRVPVKRADRKRIWFEISPLPPSAGIYHYSLSLMRVIPDLLILLNFPIFWIRQDWFNTTLCILLMALLGWLTYNLFWGEIDYFGLAVEGLPIALKKREKILERQFWKAMAVLLGGTLICSLPFTQEKLDSPFWIVRFGVLIEIMALFQDLWAQWLFWRIHGPGVELLEMDNVHLAGYLKGLFQAEGVPCHIQTYRYRSLFFFFTPLNKMRLLVPEGQTEIAKGLLAKVQYQVV